MATGQQQEGKESPRYFFRSVSDRNYPRDFINRGTRLVTCRFARPDNSIKRFENSR